MAEKHIYNIIHIYKYLKAKGKSKLHDVISTAMDYNLGLRVPLKSRQDSLLFQGVSQPPNLGKLPSGFVWK